MCIRDRGETEKDYKTPGDLLKEMLRLDERLDKQLKLIISFRPEIMHQTSRAFNAIYNAKPDTPDIWPAEGNKMCIRDRLNSISLYPVKSYNNKKG